MTDSPLTTSSAETSTPQPEALIACGKCGTGVPASESVYVDGGGQMCQTCFPPWDFLTITEPPF